MTRKPQLKRKRAFIAMAPLGLLVCLYLVYEAARPRNEVVYYASFDYAHGPFQFEKPLDKAELAAFEHAYVRVSYGSRGEVVQVTKILGDGTIHFIKTYEYVSLIEMIETTRTFEANADGRQQEITETRSWNRLTLWIPQWFTW
jgi:hypothetical protein